MKKVAIDSLFIVFSAVILILLMQYGYMEKYKGLALMPIVVAYYFGQFVQIKFGAQTEEGETEEKV